MYYVLDLLVLRKWCRRAGHTVACHGNQRRWEREGYIWKIKKTRNKEKKFLNINLKTKQKSNGPKNFDTVQDMCLLALATTVLSVGVTFITLYFFLYSYFSLFSTQYHRITNFQCILVNRTWSLSIFFS